MISSAFFIHCSFPERAETLFTEAEDKSVERYNHLLKLKDLYAPQA